MFIILNHRIIHFNNSIYYLSFCNENIISFLNFYCVIFLGDVAKELVTPSLSVKVMEVKLLNGKKISFHQTNEGITINTQALKKERLYITIELITDKLIPSDVIIHKFFN